MMFLLPNAITLASLFCGFDAIRTAAGSDPRGCHVGAVLLVFALVFDILDGRVARLTKTQSAFGLQIDSLADVVSFGIAPAFLIYMLSLRQGGLVGLVAAFCFAAAGAIRLARFNVLSMGDVGAPKAPSAYILGLPVPGAAAVLVSLILLGDTSHGDWVEPTQKWAITALTLVLSALMVSRVRFRSFKNLSMNARTLAVGALVLASSLTLALWIKPAAVLLWLISLYVLTAVAEPVVRRLRRNDTVDAEARLAPYG
jgi:CDP-diacylglycerol--serine O-phosphatidyltransferase